MSHSLPGPALARPRKPSFSGLSSPPSTLSASTARSRPLLRWPRSKLSRVIFCVLVAAGLLWFSTRRRPQASNRGAWPARTPPATTRRGARTFPVLPRDAGPGPRTVSQDRSRTPTPASAGSAFLLTPSQEFASLLTFLLSSPFNSLPLDTDPAAILDPDAILDVSLPAQHAARNRFLDELTKETWARWPVILIGRRGESTLEKLKGFMAHEGLMGRQTKGMSILELNPTRPDHVIALALIARLTSDIKLPLLLVGGEVLGSLDEVMDLDETDELTAALARAGVEVGKELRMREEFERALKVKEKAERERILGMGEAEAA